MSRLSFLGVVLAAPLFALVACSSDNGGSSAPKECTVEGIWSETDAKFTGEADTFCPQLETTLKYDLDQHELTKNDTTYSDRRKSDNSLVAWTPDPDTCHLATKPRNATGNLKIGSKEYKLTFTADDAPKVVINGATAKYSVTETVTASPALDGTPCKLTQEITLTHE